MKVYCWIFVLVWVFADQSAYARESTHLLFPAHWNSLSGGLDEFDDVLMSAYSLYLQKKYDAALADCAKAAQMRPTDNRPYAISGLIYMAQWKMKSASDAFAKAISFSPQNKKLYFAKAKADRFRNARDESVAAARKAIELDPNYAEAYGILGEALSIGSTANSEAIQAYRTAIRLNPQLLDAYTQLGKLLSASKDKKGAEEIYRRAIDADANHMAGRFDLGRLLVEQGRLKEARELWNARTSDKDHTFPNFIELLKRAENRKAAEDALAQKPNDPDTLVQMGLAVMEGDSWVVDGRQDKAIVYFKRALELRPDFARAQYAICNAYVQIADTYKDKNRNLDEEIAKLRKMDPKLADDVTAYRKTYQGAITGTPAKLDQ